MTILADIKHKDIISTEEAVEVIDTVVNRYQRVIERIIGIKLSHPPSDKDESFIRQGNEKNPSAQVEQLTKLRDALLALQQQAHKICDNLLAEKQTDAIEKNNTALYNEALMKYFDKTNRLCHQIHGQSSRHFAILLTELDDVYKLFQQKLNFENTQLGKMLGQSAEQKEQQRSALESQSLKDDEKLVYIRVFHRDLIDFGHEKSAMSVIRTLFESILQAEKHGFAIYADEEIAKRSLKDERYAYVTMSIKKEQDVTDIRDEKLDPHLHCQLLTVENLSLSGLRNFHHRGSDYPIIDGIITGI